MSPKRKPTAAAPSPIRATRSATRSNKASLHAISDNPEPRKNNPTNPVRERIFDFPKRKRTNPSASDVPDPNARATRSARGKSGIQAPPNSPLSDAESVGPSYKTIVIEHCKQCISFLSRAHKVKKGVEGRVAGVDVVINPVEPRKGCFEIREEGGKVLLSLTDMKRPFKKLKELDMDEVVADVVAKIERSDSSSESSSESTSESSNSSDESSEESWEL